jgi:glutamine synthetase
MTSSCLEYIWLDANSNFRSKTRIIHGFVERLEGSLANVPIWNYDGSSTGQAECENSEITLIPCAIFKDPFRDPDRDFLILCSTYNSNGDALKTNNRHAAERIFTKEAVAEHVPQFGIEQEYYIFNSITDKPIGYSDNMMPGQYYCGVGALCAFGRPIVEDHLKKCLIAGIKICGINAEVSPGQWEFQIGVCDGIEVADHLWTARYILDRVAENHGTYISYHPKPVYGNWSGSGGHTNFSTVKTRNPDGGLDAIYAAIEKLKNNHIDHIQIYGKDISMRLTGRHETSSFFSFTSGVANRNVSIRIGYDAVKNGCGYFEDRRPNSNMDPYLVVSKLFDTVCLSKTNV